MAYKHYLYCDCDECRLRLAYLAGFFDGEGSIIICKDKTRLGNPSYRLRITANGVLPEPLILMKDTFGGLLQVQKRPNPKHRDIHSWQQHSLKAIQALELLEPYLLVKKDQAKFAITWGKINTTFQGKKKTEQDFVWFEQQREILHSMKGFL